MEVSHFPPLFYMRQVLVPLNVKIPVKHSSLLQESGPSGLKEVLVDLIMTVTNSCVKKKAWIVTAMSPPG